MEETAQRKAASRSLWSTVLVSAFGGPLGGFLWIGAGRLALISLVVIGALSFALVYLGFPVSPVGAWVANLSRIGLMILSALLVVPFARRFKPDKWYAHGLSVLGLVLLTALLIRSFLFQLFLVPSSSMVPTLQVGDYFIVSKLAYGYSRYSVPFNLLQIDGRLLGAKPKRGDVVVFAYPPDPRVDYVQRIVGLPGEKIQMVGGVLHINDLAVGVVDIGSYSSEGIPKAKLERETLPGGVTHTVLNLTDNSIGDNTRAWIVPAGHYFVLGDNRDNASDSRFNVGFVPAENLVGRVIGP